MENPATQTRSLQFFNRLTNSKNHLNIWSVRSEQWLAFLDKNHDNFTPVTPGFLPMRPISYFTSIAQTSKLNVL